MENISNVTVFQPSLIIRKATQIHNPFLWRSVDLGFGL